MYGNKMNLRKKAMDSMMREKPAMEFKKRSSPEMGGEENGEESGMISMMVTPEEKEMILSMRDEGKDVNAKPGMEDKEDEMMG